MMKENSPIGVTARPTRSAAFALVPIATSPMVQAVTRPKMVSTATPRMSQALSPRRLTSICMPMATKNTALNTSRSPAKVRSTCVRCGVSATMAPSRNAPRASE